MPNSLSNTLPDSLPAKVFLLACDADRHRRQHCGELKFVVRGAILADLTLRECLSSDEDGYTKASGAKRTGDRVLDGTLREIRESRPRRLRAWIRRGAKRSVADVQAQLVAAGVIRVRRAYAFGVFPVRHVDVVDAAGLAALRARVRDVVRGTGPIASVAPAEATLVSLAVVGEVRGTLSRRERRAYADRIAALLERGGDAVPALRGVLRQVKLAKMAAASAYGG